MAITTFIPEVWAAVAEMQLRKSLVYAQEGIINRNYEGEISDFGDKVTINMISTPTIGNATKYTSIGDPEQLNAADTALLIDQSKFYNFMIDDVDKAQTKPKLMESYIQEAQYGMADTVDQWAAALMAAAVPSDNTLGTTGSPKTDVDDAGKAYEYLVELGTLLSNAKVPRMNRWVIVPPWFYGYLQKDDRFVKAGTPRTDEVLRNGIIGEAAGFRVIESHNVPNATSTTGYKIIAGVQSAMTFASQLVKQEAYRPPNFFADAVKALHVYGGKVVFPSRLAMLIANVT